MASLFEEWEAQSAGTGRASTSRAVRGRETTLLAGMGLAATSKPVAYASSAAPPAPLMTIMGSGGGFTASLPGRSTTTRASLNPFADDALPLPFETAAAESRRKAYLPIFSLKRIDLTGPGGGPWGGGPWGGNRGGSERDRGGSSTSPPWSIVSAAVGNNVLVMATSTGRVVRWNVDKATETEEVEIARGADAAIHKVFMDPTGNHVVVGTRGGDNYYLHARAARPRKLIRWQGAIVEAIAFDRQRGTEASTKSILVGTSEGDIFEASLESGGKDRPLTYLYTLGRSSSAAAGTAAGGAAAAGQASGVGGGIAISDLHFESVSSAVQGESRLFVLAATATPTRLYSFAGGPSFEILFRDYRESGAVTFQELPGAVPATKLRLFTQGSGGSGGGGGGGASQFSRLEPPRAFAMLTAVGIYHGGLAFGGAGIGNNGGGGSGGSGRSGGSASGGGGSGGGQGAEGIVVDAQLLPYTDATAEGTADAAAGAVSSGTAVERSGRSGPRSQGVAGSGGPPPPLSIVLTEYHFVLLYASRLEVISRLSGRAVQTDALDSHWGHSLALVPDPVRGPAPHLWLFTDRAPVQVVVQGEDRDVWRLYLDKALAGDERQFDVALRRCHDAAERAQVHYVHGNLLFRCGNRNAAARHWAKAPGCFEEAALKLHGAGGMLRAISFGGGYGGGGGFDSGFGSAATGAGAEAESDFGAAAAGLAAGEVGVPGLLGDEEALKVYLLEKLEQLTHEPAHGKMQRTMLCTWLAEIYLHSFIYLAPSNGGTSGGNGAASKALTAEFRQFLKQHAAALNPATTFALLTSHDRSEELLYYAELIGDYERIIAFHMGGDSGGTGGGIGGGSGGGSSDGNAKSGGGAAGSCGGGSRGATAALDVLRKAPFEKVESLMYKHSARLMEADPASTVRTWMDRPQLRPTKLIPALVHYSESRRAARRALAATAATAIASCTKSGSGGGGSGASADGDVDWAVRYLEYCVDVLRQPDAATHNHLLTLYAQAEAEAEELAATAAAAAKSLGKAAGRRDSVAAGADGAGGGGSGSALLRFVTRPPERRFFDLQYALRVCAEYKRTRVCVHLYAAMGLHTEAVQLALRTDVALAKANADRPADPELRRRLWLMVARHTVEQRGGDVKDALAVLQECGSDLLRIEDVLPFFPDFAVIDAFKAEICASLEGYNGRIEGLRREMDEYAASAGAIQEEIAGLRRRSMYLSSSQTCELCGAGVLATQFYLFPCAHAFHFKCLLDHVRPHLTPAQSRAVEGLLEKLGRGEMPPPLLPSPPPAVAAVASGAAGRDGGGSSAASAAGGIGEAAVDASARAEHYQQALQTELDGYVGAECVLCGDLMIRSVSMPLIGPGEEAEAAQWE